MVHDGNVKIFFKANNNNHNKISNKMKMNIKCSHVIFYLSLVFCDFVCKIENDIKKKMWTICCTRHGFGSFVECKCLTDDNRYPIIILGKIQKPNSNYYNFILMSFIFIEKLELKIGWAESQGCDGNDVVCFRVFFLFT